MIKVNIGEIFPITVALVDEGTGTMATGKTVNYTFRTHPDDQILSPAMSGVLLESVVEPGVYSETFYLSNQGQYIAYTSCSGFTSGAEDIIVEEDDLADLIKQNRQYNLSVEDVIRENVMPTASQTIRNVSLGNTDYIINAIKWDTDSDWSSTTVSGMAHAWYKTLDDAIPYKIGEK